MGLFNFRKKAPATVQANGGPYADSATNFIYNLLFCDDPDLYKTNTASPYTYPFDILFSETSSVTDLQKIIDDGSTDPRVRVLAYNKQRSVGHQPNKKELLAVIVEIGMDRGLDVLASFKDGTARYINQTGKVLIWESTTDENANELIRTLFSNGESIIAQIGPWDKPRKPAPTRNNARLSFLVSDGLYFGEGPVDVLFKDSLANPALTSATQILKYLTEKSLQSK